jgi:hypothetical protein
MKKSEIIDALRRDSSGGDSTSQDWFTASYLGKILDEIRATAINMIFRKTGSINSINDSCSQNYYLPYDPTLQASPQSGVTLDYVIYRFPSVIQMGDEDGIRYFGSNLFNCIQNFERIRSVEEFANMQQNWYTKVCNNPNTIYYMLDSFRHYILVWNGQDLRDNLFAKAIFQSPSDALLYNEELDDYPADPALVEYMRDVLIQKFSEIKAQKSGALDYEQPNTTPNTLPRQLKLGEQGQQ